MPESACAEAAEWEQACNGHTVGLIPTGKSTFPLPVRWSTQVEAKFVSGMQFSIRCTGHGGKRLGVDGHTLNAPVLRVKGSTATWYELRGGSWFSDSRKATCLPDDGYPAAPTGFDFQR